MISRRNRFAVGGFASLVVVAVAGLLVQQHTARKLQGPFRIGFFKSGIEHFLGPDGKPHGAAIELLNEAAQRRGMKLEWVYSPEGTDAALESGHVDLWPNAGDIPERKGRIYVSQPWNILKYAVMSVDDNQVVVGDDRGSLVVARGTQNVDAKVANRYFPQAKALTLPGPTEIYRAICTKEAE